MDLSIIKELRKEKNLSQQELGNKLGVSGAYIQQIESNKKNPSMKTLARIAEALEVPTFMLTEEKEVANLFAGANSFSSAAVNAIKEILNDKKTTVEEKSKSYSLFKDFTKLELTKTIFKLMGYKIDLSCSPIVFIKDINTGEDVSRMNFDQLQTIASTINLTTKSVVNEVIRDYSLNKSGEKDGE